MTLSGVTNGTLAGSKIGHLFRLATWELLQFDLGR